jgi:hypothetical protein
MRSHFCQMNTARLLLAGGLPFVSLPTRLIGTWRQPTYTTIRIEDDALETVITMAWNE